MIVFHEGLPGAGKTYEACLYHIFPALKAGRRVVTNVEGINHAKFAELLGIPEVMIKQFLICVHDHDVEKQKQALLEQTQKDSLVVIDEIQNLFPSGRDKLDDAWNRYISEHRHDGLDIILMGQDRRDCHNMWRRRIQRVITFKKMTALGANNSYAWACLEATGPEKFKQVTAGRRSYDQKYFGLYSSFTDGTNHKSVYVDKRATVWNHAGFKFGIPIFIAALIFSGKYLYAFFHAEKPAVPTAQKYVRVDNPNAPGPGVQPASAAEQSKPDKAGKKPEYEAVDVFDQQQHDNTLRLSGYVIPQNGDMSRLLAYVDVIDKTFHLKDRYSVAALRDMGWEVSLRESGLQLVKAGRTLLARPLPIDHPGKIDEDTRRSLTTLQYVPARSEPGFYAVGDSDKSPTAQEPIPERASAPRLGQANRS